MYEYNVGSTNEAVDAAKNAESYVESIPSDLSTASTLASTVKVNGLEFLNNANYRNTINTISSYSSIIISMISQAERSLIIDCLTSGNRAKLIQYINAGKISMQAMIEYSKEYMINIMNSGNINSYNVGFAVIGGPGSAYANVNSAFAALGFSEDFINSLSSEYCKNLINNNLMYSKEGAVTMAVSFTGLLSMLGLKLGYSHTEFDRSYDGFYFGTGQENSKVLGAIDCCNYTDWISRCVGIDIYAYGPDQKWYYGNDGITPMNELNAGPDSPYFRNGEGGDYLANGGHIMMIVGNDGKGYYFAENGNYAEINYRTFDELARQGYKVTNTDALYRNTSTPHPQEYIWVNEDGSLAEYYNTGNKVQKEEVFANPYWIINQKNINLSLEEQEKLIKQYNERNKNENFTGVVFKPTHPEVPTQPVEPEIPETPEVPVEPEVPETPEEPTDPVVPKPPEKPTDPVVPKPPEKPTDPVVPKPPEKPTDPVVPKPPEKPTDPVVPKPPEEPTEPVVPVPEKNILPDNRFSDYIPGMSTGDLGAMEISQSGVSYEIYDVGAENYNNYIQKLLEEGYTMSEDGVFIKDNYQLVTTLNEDGSMSIVLKTI